MIEPLPRPRPPALPRQDESTRPRAYIFHDVLEELRFNGGWARDQVAGGLLAGRHFMCPETQIPYVEIAGYVAGTHCHDLEAFAKHLRIQWKAAATSLRYHFPEDELVGWYAGPHNKDFDGRQDAALVHNTFFSHPWQVGLWVPPDGGIACSLTRRDGGLEAVEVGVIGPR